MSAPVRYRPWHITSATPGATPVFPLVSTTGSVIAASGQNTVTPASMAGIAPYQFLWVYPTVGGVGTPEIVQVGDWTTLTPTTFTTQFQYPHSGYNLVSQKPGELGPIEVGTPGQNTLLTLYMGPPALGGTVFNAPGYAFAQLSISNTMTYQPPVGFLEHTLFYTITGTGFDITIWYLAHAA